MYINHLSNFDNNECSGHGMCSVSPKISSFQEVVLMVLCHSAYYISKLELMGNNCNCNKCALATALSEMVTTTDYTDEQLLSIITCRFQDMLKLKQLYKEHCKMNNLTCIDLKSSINIYPQMNLSEILAFGQNTIVKKTKRFSVELLRLQELLFLLIKSTALSVVKLLDYGITDKYALDEIVKSLNMFNDKKLSSRKFKTAMNELAKVDLELWIERTKVQKERFGSISETEVSLSTSAGKAILVSGSSLVDLASLLEVLKNDTIDVYTHGDLLIAHAFDYFKQFPCLKGHFGSISDNSTIDFATFPGAILLTKHATQNIEYLIRGRLYTTDNIVPKSVIKIENNNFDNLINAAKSAKGFKHGQIRDRISVGINLDEISQKFDDIITKLNSGLYKKLFIVGMANYSIEQADYFDKLFDKVSKDCIVISFSYYSNSENLLHINVANNHPCLLEILNLLFQKIAVTSDNYVYFLAKCDANTISSMIGLRDAGVKNVYLSACPPTVLNPAIIDVLVKLYGINKTTSVQNDLENIFKQ